MQEAKANMLLWYQGRRVSQTGKKKKFHPLEIIQIVYIFWTGRKFFSNYFFFGAGGGGGGGLLFCLSKC